MDQWESSELEQKYGISRRKNYEVEVLLVVDLIADSASFCFLGQGNTGVRFGTGPTAVVGVGIADGSRAKYDVDVLTPEKQCRGIGHDMILELVFFSTD